MLRAVFSSIAWLAVFCGAIIFPTLLFLSGDTPPGRPFWIEFGVMLGFAMLMTLSIQFLLTSRFRRIGKPFGTDTVLQFHRYLGILLLCFLLGHPLVLIFTEPKYLEYFDPRVNFLRAIFLIMATIAIILLVVLSLWRKKIKLGYEWWRITHALLATGVVVVGMAHSWQVEHYVQGLAKRILLITIGGGAILTLAYVRLWRPLQMRKRPYKIVEIRNELGDSSTIAVEPVGHRGITFRSGQYAWLTLGDSPFKLQQNPYSFSSSALDAPEKVEFTAKVLGDFSEKLVNAASGDTIYLEGPYGLFCLGDDAPGAIFIMGGIGITPAMSILRTLRDRNDPRPLILIYGNTCAAEIAFRSELEELERLLNLQVIHVLNEPDDDWQGERGYIDRDLLGRNLPAETRDFSVFICGPEPMMDSAEDGVLELNFGLHQIRAERFDIV